MISSLLRKCGLPLFLLLNASPITAANSMLVIGTNSDPFSAYYPEILRAEGLNVFDYADISTISGATLSGYKIVVLAPMTLTSGQVTALSSWVQTSGGKLIAIKPDKQLATLLGLIDTGTSLTDPYLLVQTAAPPGAGIVGQTMQIHGTADAYTLNGATAAATLYQNATAPSIYPAVTIRSLGTGEATAFTYDLARSIVLTRQGNPAWSGHERDGIAPIRSDDLFFGNAGFDPQPDWVNPSKVGIPQADEQQRFLVNVILHLTRDRLPMPRFWYLPFFKKAAVVMTGDDHGNGATAGRFDAHKTASTPGCSVADWECIRSTSYIFTNTPLTNQQATAYNAEGFEIGLHVNTNCADYTPSSLQTFYTSQLIEWRSKYTGVPSPVTNRTHCIAWSDYDTQPQVELAAGIRFDTNYYYWPGSWLATVPGYFTGSAMPMKFTKANGSLINVYQATTQMTDESSQSFPSFAATLLDNALGPLGYYGVLTANMHTDSNTGDSALWSSQIIDAAKLRGVPVVSSRQMLTWLDGRNASALNNVSWNGSALSFSVAPAAGSNGLQAMIPASFQSAGLTGLTRGGVAVPYAVERIKGVMYAIFAAAPGSYEATYAASLITVAISPTSATVGAGQSLQFTATVTGSANTDVIWSVSPPVGSISTSGVYTPPGTLTSIRNVTVTAYSAADVSKFASAAVRLGEALVISSVTTSANAGSATVSWITDEPSTSVIDYGTAPGQLNNRVMDASIVTNHNLTLPNLVSGTRYYYRLTSVGTSTAVWPAAGKPPAEILASASFSIWSGSTLPLNLQAADPSSVELGVKFRSATAGQVNGLRFYKATGNSGTHIGNLWAANGTSLASVTFVNETPSGWQEALFPAPVSISANTTYVVSYFAPAGNYSYDSAYFANNGITNGPLTALRNGQDGPNAVYRYTSASAFPTDSFNSTNYWVDVLFTDAVADTTAPVISGVTVTPQTTSATIAWNTNEAATSVVEYGTTAALGSTVTGTPDVTAHSVQLLNLTPGTQYHFRISSTDSSNNRGTSPALPAPPATFTTVALDTTPPVISGVNVVVGTNTTITWTTDEVATSFVKYGSSAANLDVTAVANGSGTSHTVVLSGLTPGAVYYYRLESTDTLGNTATLPAAPNAATFTVPGDSTPPVISAVQAAAGSITATITWTTNEPSNSRVEYGTSSGTLNLFATDAANVVSHQVVLSGLTAGTSYFYRVVSADAAGNSSTSPGTAQAPLSFNTTSPDTTPPVISLVSAAPSGMSATITWTTNEDSDSRVAYGLTPTSLGSSLSDSARVKAHTITLTGLTPNTNYYFRVTSADAAGNPATSPVASQPAATFRTANEAAFSVWPSTAVPARADDGDTLAVTIGMKFRTTTTGSVTGVRFYKSAKNTGAHVGHLWSSTGTLLSSVNFMNETASGWQQALFPAPVPVTAGVTYIVSYHAPAGHYSVTDNGFETSGVYNAPLYALRNGVDGANGVYRYGTAAAFPDQTFNATNYWVDVVFSAAATTAVTKDPASVTVVTGTLRAGSATALRQDENTFYQVNSTTSGTRNSAWYATFTGIPRTTQSLRVAYVGKNSVNCTETISIWRWQTSTWVQLNSATVGTGEVFRNLQVPGVRSDYVSGSGATGDTRVRVACTGSNANFFSSGDLMELTYTP